jgi:LEA14-like dessication related protein
MKKSTVVVLILLIIILAVVLVFIIPWLKERKEDPYATLVKPRIESMSMLIKEMNKERTTMDMRILIDNPAPVGLTIDSLSYKMYIGEAEVMKSSYPKEVKLEGSDSSWISLPVTIYNEKLIKTLKDLEEKKVDSIDYTVKSLVYANIPLKDDPIELEFSKKGPVFIIPRMKVKGVKIKKFGLNESKAIFTAEVENPNPIPFQYKQTSYKVKIDKDKLMEGKMDQPIIIPKYGKEEIEMPVEVSLKETGETIFKMLVKPGDVDYKFSFETTLIAESNMLKESKLFLEDEGKLKELLKK